ncbi:MAG TPA: hypothetical protein VI757_16500 [Bacteroidia bacterium]|nr:hypothetical protein [Bacteroidia bacterium]
MRQITISIPESFYKTFLEFFKYIPEAKIEETETFSIPAWHKEETMKRMKDSKEENFIPWSKAKKQLKSRR